MPTSKKLNDLQVIKMPKAVYNSVGNVNADGLHIITKDDNDNKLEVYSTQQTDKLIADTKNSPALTGTPTAPTAAKGTNTTQIATTAFVQTAVNGYAPINSPTLTGTPKAPTAAEGTNTTQIATTAFVQTAIEGAETISLDLTLSASGWTGSSAPYSQVVSNKFITANCDGMVSFASTITDAQLAIASEAQIRLTSQANGSITVKAFGTKPTVDVPITLVLFGITTGADTSEVVFNSPALTGTPTAPTPSAGDNCENIATTAFVHNEIETEINSVKSYVQEAVSACKSVVLNFTLSASKWSNNKQTLTNSSIKADGNGFIVFTTGISEEALAAAKKSQITISSQANGSMVISTNGTTPTVDIPITLIILP